MRPAIYVQGPIDQHPGPRCFAAAVNAKLSIAVWEKWGKARRLKLSIMTKPCCLLPDRDSLLDMGTTIVTVAPGVAKLKRSKRNEMSASSAAEVWGHARKILP